MKLSETIERYIADVELEDYIYDEIRNEWIPEIIKLEKEIDEYKTMHDKLDKFLDTLERLGNESN